MTPEQQVAEAWLNFLKHIHSTISVETTGEGDDEAIVITASNGATATITINDVFVETRYSDGSVFIEVLPFEHNAPDIDWDEYMSGSDWLPGIFDKTHSPYDPEATGPQ